MTFSCKNFIFNVFSFCSTAFRTKTTKFLTTYKTGFLPKITSQLIHLHAHHTLKNALQVSESDNIFTDSLARSGIELWPIKTKKTTIVASAKDCIV